MIDTNGFKPIVSPLGTHSYDFETMIGYVSAPFNTYDNQPYSDPITILAYSSAYLLHTCTLFGFHKSMLRFQRMRYGDSFLTEAKDSNNSILLQDKDDSRENLSLHLRGLYSSETYGVDIKEHFHKPSSNTLYACHLAEQILFNREHSEQINADLNSSHRALLESYSVIDVIYNKLSPVADASDTGYLSVTSERYKHLFEKSGIVNVSYKGECSIEIRTVDLIRCYMALSEIYLRQKFLGENTQIYFEKFQEDRAFVCVKMALYYFGLPCTTFEIACMIPEILLAIEISLNGEILPSKNPNHIHSSFIDFYPPSKFLQILEKTKNGNSLLVSDDQDHNRFRSVTKDRYPELDTRQKFLDNYISTYQETDIIRENYLSGSTKFPHQSWEAWYRSFQRATLAHINARGISVTEYILHGSKLDAEDEKSNIKFGLCPLIIDQSGTCFSSSYLREDSWFFEKRGAYMKSYVSEILRSYWLNSIFFETDAITPFPYEIPSEVLYDRWQILSYEQLDGYIRNRCNLGN